MERRRLAELPNELLTQILSNICAQSHLAKITLVSKRFKVIVEFLLYRHISLDIQYSAKELRNTRTINQFSHTTIPSFVPFDRLIDNLSVRQGLGKHVRTLALRVRRRLWYKPFAGDLRLLEQLPELRALSLSPPPLHSSIPHNDWAIQSLRLDFNYVIDHYAESRDWVLDGVPLQIIARYLRLSRLRKLQIEMIVSQPHFDGMCHLPIGSSSVEDLRILGCFPDNDHVLASFLRSNKHLKRFVIELLSMTYRTAEIISGNGAFEKALLGHQETIEELAVANSGGLPLIEWDLGPFTQWSNLKCLAVPRYMLPGSSPMTRDWHEILPPLLEEIQIEYPVGYRNRALLRAAYQLSIVPPIPDTYHGMTDAVTASDATDLQQLAENKDFYVPRLKRIIWWYQTPTQYTSDYPEDPTDSKLVRLLSVFVAFDRVGVKFEWVTQPLFKDTPFGKRLYDWQE